MAKVGRNHPCPCRSGKKYKHCCLRAEQVNKQTIEAQQAIATLQAEVVKIQQVAADRQENVYELGVFIFLSTVQGDAWLLEVTDGDAVQVAREGQALEAPIDENAETIEINWSHRFALRDKQLFMTPYGEEGASDGQEQAGSVRMDTLPTQRISAAMRRIMKRYSPELLEQVHVDADR